MKLKRRLERGVNGISSATSTCREVEVLDESELLIRNDRILVADNTLVETQDGEVEAVDGLIIQTSQPCTFDVGSDYFIHLQISNATVDGAMYGRC